MNTITRDDEGASTSNHVILEVVGSISDFGENDSFEFIAKNWQRLGHETGIEEHHAGLFGSNSTAAEVDANRCTYLRQ